MLNVIYEDNHLLVVEKPVNILSQGDNTNDDDMVNLLKKYLKEKFNKPGNVLVGLVHRLDRPVGGIEWREGISSGSISYGLEIVDIEGLEQQGLQICYLAPQEIAGQKNFKTRTIYWDCGVWRVCQ